MFFFSIGLDRLSIMIIGINRCSASVDEQNATTNKTSSLRTNATNTVVCKHLCDVVRPTTTQHRTSHQTQHRTSLSFANIFANKTQQTRNGSIAMTHRRNVGARHRPRIMVAPKEKKASRLCMASKPSMDGLRSCAI